MALEGSPHRDTRSQLGAMGRTSGQEPDTEWTVEGEQAAFRAVPEPDTERARQLLPDVVEVCGLLGRTQSLNWNMVAIPSATVSRQLSPKDVFQLCKSVEVPGSLWTMLLHPGSTNTSGLLKVLTNSMELIYDRRNEEEYNEASQKHKDECDKVRTEAQDPEKARLPKFEPPPRRKGLAGGGSLAAAGFTASREQNRCSMTAIEPELEGILAWLAQEFAVDVAVAAKLWDALTWDRPVMDGKKAFEMRLPFFSFIAGGHLKELLRALKKDTFGLRQRITVVYARPSFLDIQFIESACDELPAETEHIPAKFLAFLLYPLFAWSLKQDAAKKEAGKPLGTVFTPDRTDGAKDIVWAKFNARNRKQDDCYLQPGMHETSKYHGKLKTKCLGVTW